ncbi:DNA-directed RNA polymerase subunit omega [Vulcanibacillus modesticaldus]|uniref:DNA-directed RNA polymerase subunit omega n=1 Tax=Vulcanibacillus modesticaldus TaxID=337097 RepID=A0A1D2YTS3_9BACI|nr:DNA-directed RNA polymerase subunit omega [Vulcanibacillus modesticaldus]OEF99087.1 DNA-directed RNA polymerase subunit omega [Vulcanibacillus modesticaldus]
MLYPSIDKLLEKVDSKYSLVVATARRTRDLKNGDTLLIDAPKSKKYVGMALEEIFSDRLILENK